MNATSRIFLWAYQAVMSLLIPVFLARLAWRSRRQPAYRSYWSERLGLYTHSQQVKKDCIWIHAVSVGETRACVPLIAEIRARWPGQPILMTHTTPTGRETGEALFGDSLTRCYLPYDFLGAQKRFLNHFQPQIGLMMETEIWPGVVAACKNKNLPVILLSGRLSARSAKGYAKLGRLIQEAFAGLTLVCAQTEGDANRFKELSSSHVVVTGNLKFDAPIASDEIAQSQILRSWVGENRPVLLLASTREGEEALILNAWKQEKTRDSNALLVIVPRHPDRFEEVARLIRDADLNFVRKTEMPHAFADSVEVVLGDTMGEMALWYRVVDLAYIGGSLIPLGGQNLLEACVRECPIIVGPHTFNFSQATEEALFLGAAIRVDSALTLVQQAMDLLKNPAKRSQMGMAGASLVRRHQGATQRTVDQIKPWIRN